MAEYDNYDYPAYWIGREYEHESEVVALKNFLNRIPRINRLMEMGCGYGRLAPYYAYRSKKVVLLDPSRRLLAIAKKKLKGIKTRKEIQFVPLKLENVARKFRNKSFDVVVMVRVLHHLENPERAIENAGKLLKTGGFLIVEFANKIHGKAVLTNLIHGNIVFPVDIFPRSLYRSRNKSGLAFNNYHPDAIKFFLKKHGFQILEVRSVSNVRSPLIKKYLPLNVLISLERVLQTRLARIYFGPSIFILAKKRG